MERVTYYTVSNGMLRRIDRRGSIVLREAYPAGMRCCAAGIAATFAGCAGVAVWWLGGLWAWWLIASLCVTMVAMGGVFLFSVTRSRELRLDEDMCVYVEWLGLVPRVERLNASELVGVERTDRLAPYAYDNQRCIVVRRGERILLGGLFADSEAMEYEAVVTALRGRITMAQSDAVFELWPHFLTRLPRHGS